MGVMDGDYLGIYNLVTAEDCRRRGIGTELLLHLLDWGIDNAATTAYLQVMLNNEPALKMYERLGFRELYQYWYRVQSD
jgi:ribosomal protein S18 acetylase RimI-like enzyme